MIFSRKIVLGMGFGVALSACGDDGTGPATVGTTTQGDSTSGSPTGTVPTTGDSLEPTGPSGSTDASASGDTSTTAMTTEDTATTMAVVTTGDPTGDTTTGNTTTGDTTTGDTTTGDTSTGGPDLVCQPNSKVCDGEVSKICNAEGTEEELIVCDSVQGVTCDEDLGECVGACSPKALGTSYIGCDYYPTITANIVDTDFSFAVVVANTSDVAAQVVIEKNGNIVQQQQVAAESVAVIKLPWDLTLKGANETPTSMLVKGGAYRLRSNQPVTVYQYNPIEYTLGFFNDSFTNDASLLLPVNVWTGDYVVVARNTWDAVDFNQRIPGFYAVTASEDDTTVTLLPSETGKLVSAGGGVANDGTGQVLLNRGDVLQVFSAVNVPGNPSPADVTGTRIAADKRVQVIGGHVCTFVPFNIGYCDHLEESMFPVETLAKEYIVTPPLIPTGGNVPKAQMVRIVAVEDDTSLSYDPPQGGAPVNIAKAGDYIELTQTVANFEVSSDKRIIVAQTMLGQDAGGDSGDPAMALAVATAQFRKNYLFHAPINYESNYVNIVAPLNAQVSLDGMPVAGFVPIGATMHAVARVKLGNNVDGNHTIDSNQAIGISVYGYGQYTSYWYPGGLDLELLPQ